MRTWIQTKSQRHGLFGHLVADGDPRRLVVLMLLVVLAALVFLTHRRADPANLGNALPPPHVPGKENLDGNGGAGKKIQDLKKEIFTPERPDAR